MRRATIVICLAATVGGLALTACGGSGSSISNASGTGDSSAQLALAKCMRSHGVSGFPDPGSVSPSGSGAQVSVLGILLPSTIDINAPAFKAAMSTCRTLITGGRQPHAVSAAEKQALLRVAQCMRTHGVPNYPDPVFPSSGGIGEGLPPNGNPNAPAFQRAQKACGNL